MDMMSLKTIGIITQEANTVSKMLVYARNGFINMSCLEMMWMVRYHWPAGGRSSLNCYKDWAQLLLLHMGQNTDILHS